MLKRLLEMYWPRKAVSLYSDYDSETDTEEQDSGSKFGKIHSSIFYYITPPMFIVTIAVAGIVFNGVGILKEYFVTNVQLNGLIISVALFSFYKIFDNCIILWKIGSFLRKADALAELDHVGPEEVNRMHHLLHTRGYMLDTKHMNEIVSKAEQYGRIQFTENEARIVKSKFGYRARIQMSGVSFLGGMLVMLGLLGTFLGLLKTIDAVGDAMMTMSSMGSDPNADMGEQMSEFIASLAAPLQGMGLAFSSSLFGLSSSLLSGFLNHLAGISQNRFIEDVSRWIDEHIPKVDSKKQSSSTPEKNRKSANEDLEGWLASFIFLSNKTNQRIGRLLTEMVLAREENSNIAKYTKKAHAHQEEISIGVKEINKSIQDLSRKHDEGIAENQKATRRSEKALSTIDSSIRSLNKNTVTSIKPVIAKIFEGQKAAMSLVKKIDMNHNEISKVMSKLENNTDKMSETAGSMRSVSISLKDMIEENATSSKSGYEAIRASYDTVESAVRMQSGAFEDMVKEISETTREGYEALNNSYYSMENILKIQAENNEKSTNQIAGLKEPLETTIENQNKLISEILALKTEIENSEEEGNKISLLVNELTLLLEEMNHNSAEKFYELFSAKNKDS